MKIILAHNTYKVTGGTEVFYHEVGRILEKRGHEVAYFSARDSESVNCVWNDYFPSAPDYLNGSLMKRMLGFKKMVYSGEAKKNFSRLIKDFQPDLVHIFSVYIKLTPSILDACREAKVKVVMSCNEYKHICPNYKLFHHGKNCYDCKGGKYYKAVLNKCAKDSLVFSVASCLESYVQHKALNIYRGNVDTFLFASNFMKEITETFWGKDTFKAGILRNPFNISEEYKSDARAGDYVLFFGRLVEEKGVDILLRAMQAATPAKLLIVGDGPQRETLIELGKKLDLHNVDFVGPKWSSEMIGILQNARFVVVPSIWHENFPYVILQAFAAGKAVIGSDMGGIPEIVKDGSFGFIYPAFDHKSLSDKIMALWNDARLTKEFGNAAKEYVEREFADDNFYTNLMNIYTEVLT